MTQPESIQYFDENAIAAWTELDIEETGIQAIEQLLAVAGDIDLRRSVLTQLVPLLRIFPMMKRGLVPLYRFVKSTRVPTSFLVFMDRDRDALPLLLQILSIESTATEWLIEDPDSFDWLRLSAGQSVDPVHLKDVLLSEIQNLDEEEQVLASLNRFRKREALRVICAVSLQDMPPSVAAQQLSWIADAGVAAAVVAAGDERKGERRLRTGRSDRRSDLAGCITALGLGALGGQELELEGTLELLFLVDLEEHHTELATLYALDELQRIAQLAVSYITSPEGLGYTVHFPLSPEDVESNHAIVHDFRPWLQTVEIQGRTWQRMALLKSRYLAGNPELASQFFEELPTLVYRRYLTRTDIAGIGALKRKIDREGRIFETLPTPQSIGPVALLQGRKREIEFLTQFLQLIYGGELDRVRVANTVQAIDALVQAGCLTEQERGIMVAAYNRFYQTVFTAEMRSPFLHDRTSPTDSVYATSAEPVALGLPAYATQVETNELLSAELVDSWNRFKQVRNHLRGEVFADENQASEETDLILDPNPSPEWIDRLLEKYGFKGFNAAYRFLMELSREEVTMLSTGRCRHFLAAIAPQLLSKISQTPDPDLTLENLAVSCRSLGGKGILWELFSVHEPSMDLYVRLCGASPYLIGILTSNPGMIDELLDSLMLNRLPTDQQLGLMLHELCRGAEDIEPIIHSFKNARHLNVGVRDILGKESITDTHRALSDIADVCLHQTVEWQYNRLLKRYGIPTATDGSICKFAVVALGKLGAREPNYHSDITLLTLYDQEGSTVPLGTGRHHEPISAEYFFLQLAQKVAQAANRVWRSGRLYETKNWLVSPDRNTTLAWRLEDFSQFFMDSNDLALQRQQLCNARCVVGEPAFQRAIHHKLETILRSKPWTETDTQLVLATRQRLESTAGVRNIKRGQGGTLDVEYLAQLLLLRHVSDNSDVFATGTLETLERLRVSGYLAAVDAEILKEGYNFLRGVESGLRLMNTQARHDLPVSEKELARLAYVLTLPSSQELVRLCESTRAENRRIYDKYLRA